MNKGENQQRGREEFSTIVDNSKNDYQNSVKLVDNDNNYTQETSKKQEIAREISLIKEELSTLQNHDKQRENASFSDKNEHGGHAENEELWKTQKLSTMTVDNIYEKAKNNPFKAGMAVKKHIAQGLSAENERMLYALVVKLDFKCEGNACEIRVMDKLLPILQGNLEKLQKHSCGFDIKLLPIATFTQNTQVEVDKIKKYFGEDYLKMVETLSK